MPDILERLFLNPAYCLLKTSGSTKTAVMALEIASPLGSKTVSLRTSEGELRHCSLHSAGHTYRGCKAFLPAKYSTAAAHCFKCATVTAVQSGAGQFFCFLTLVPYREGVLHHETRNRKGKKGQNYTKKKATYVLRQAMG